MKPPEQRHARKMSPAVPLRAEKNTGRGWIQRLYFLPQSVQAIGHGFFHLRLSDLDTNQIVLNYQPMESRQASRIFEALSSDVRLDLFRLLVKNAPGGLVQGEIARQLDIPTTNLSFHLKAIVQSGLVDVEREGRFMRYKANIPLMLTIVAYLTEECCADNPEMCQRFRDCSPVKNGILPKRGG